MVLQVPKVQRADVVKWDREVTKDLRVIKVAKAKMSVLTSHSFKTRSKKWGCNIRTRKPISPQSKHFTLTSLELRELFD